MKVRIEQIVRKRRGLADVSERDVDVTTLRIGRSGSADVHLADPRVLLDHAAIEGGDGRFEVVAVGDATVLVDGRPVATAVIAPGSRISVGPYEIRVDEPSSGLDLRVVVELVHPFDAVGAAELTGDARLISGHLPSRRLIAWALSLAILVLLLVVPVIAGLSPQVREATRPFRPFAAWNSGPISNVHRPIAETCTACHARPFVRAENAQCLTCHVSIRQHADPATLDLGGERCESCHKEHNGAKLATRAGDEFCIGCHGAMASVAPKSTLLDVAGFAGSHPEFRPALVADAAGPTFNRISIEARPVERSNLRFPHDKHLRRDGLRTATGVVKLACADCHVAEPGGARMQAVRMEGQCSTCHTLAFERRFPDWTVPHGEPDKVRRTISGLYSQIALAERRGVDRAQPGRQRPGDVAPEEKTLRETDLAWVEARTEEAMASTFGASGCGLCHVTEKKAEGWAVRPVHVAQRYFEKARFSHARHKTVGCGECHSAATSTASEEVLMPGVQTCQGCHGGETPAVGKVASSCLTCHAFHTHPVAIRSAEASR